jgi:hypothetical protein
MCGAIFRRRQVTEPGLRRIRGYRHLLVLRHALWVELNFVSNYEEELA